MPTRRELLTFWMRGRGEEPEVAPPPVPRPADFHQHRLPPFLRPPSALPEAEFLEACNRCSTCAAACPHDAILPLGPAYGAGDGTPAILPGDEPCHLCDDLPCATVCPSGALRLVPLAQVNMGTARLLDERCRAVRGRICVACVESCPLGEAAIVWDGDRPRILADGCVGCGICVAACPEAPKALEIVPSSA
jgi:ferredoxin